MSDIRNIIRRLAAPDVDMAAIVCTVDAVDRTARTVDCTPIDESAPLLGVNLQANQNLDYGICVFPEVGSHVVVGLVAVGASGVVLLTERIESAEVVIGGNSVTVDRDGCRIDAGGTTAGFSPSGIVFNGGRLDGMVMINELTEKLNGLKDTVNSLITAYNTHTHVTTATIGAGTDQGVISPTESTATEAEPFVAGDYENKSIKQ